MRAGISSEKIRAAGRAFCLLSPPPCGEGSGVGVVASETPVVPVSISGLSLFEKCDAREPAHDPHPAAFGGDPPPTRGSGTARLRRVRALPAAATPAAAAAARTATAAGRNPDEEDEAGMALAKALLMLATVAATRCRNCGPTSRGHWSSGVIMPHRFGFTRMGAPERGRERMRPRLFHVERHRIRQQRLEALGGDLRRLQLRRSSSAVSSRAGSRQADP